MTPTPAQLDALAAWWKERGSDHTFTVAPLPRGHYVYIAWGADRSRPLYIGKAVNLWRRYEQHGAWKADWLPLVEELEVRSFPTAELARRAELDAIQTLNPIYNQQRWSNLRPTRVA
jgi:excinuclease UvrABC nuclease subunit